MLRPSDQAWLSNSGFFVSVCVWGGHETGYTLDTSNLSQGLHTGNDKVSVESSTGIGLCVSVDCGEEARLFKHGVHMRTSHRKAPGEI